MSASIRIDGLDEWMARLRVFRSADTTTQAVARGLFATGNRIATEAKLETPVGGPPYSPRDPHPGLLRSTGLAPFPSIDGTLVTQQVGFGGAASAYAKVQHERTDFRHHVGKAKYLKDPFDRIAPTAKDAIAAELRAMKARGAS